MVKIVGAVALVAAAFVVGEGTAHAFATPSAVNFGTIAVGASKTKAIPLKFDPGYRLQEIDSGGAGAPWFSVDVGTCALNAGEPCAFKLTFSPMATGQHLGTLLLRECPISGVGDCGVVTIPINARAGVFSTSPSKIEFGTVLSGFVKTKTVKMKFDPGYRFRTLTGDGTSAPFAYDFGDCANAQGNPCTFSVSYGAGAPYDRDVSILMTECKIVDVNQCGVILIPIHARTGAFTASPKRVNFGTVAPGAMKTKTIKLKFDSGYKFGTTGTPSAPFSVDPGTCTGNAGEPCAIALTYSPTLLGNNSMTLNVAQCPIVPGGGCTIVRLSLQGESGV